MFDMMMNTIYFRKFNILKQFFKKDNIVVYDHKYATIYYSNLFNTYFDSNIDIIPNSTNKFIDYFNTFLYNLTTNA